ncbi:MAG: AAA family ATPase [Clostridia bacterium]|nr:AAA family ATPase [Clostridia bacterium]
MATLKPLGICICGLNGCGKTTLGKVLASALDCAHLDAEDYFFPDGTENYASPRPQAEAEETTVADMAKHRRFVYSAVSGHMRTRPDVQYDLVIYLHAPRTVRLERVEARSRAKFGERVRPGGDLYDRERDFLTFIAERSPDRLEQWLATLSCPVFRLDATADTDTLLRAILSQIKD